MTSLVKLYCSDISIFGLLRLLLFPGQYYHQSQGSFASSFSYLRLIDTLQELDWRDLFPLVTIVFAHCPVDICCSFIVSLYVVYLGKFRACGDKVVNYFLKLPTDSAHWVSAIFQDLVSVIVGQLIH